MYKSCSRCGKIHSTSYKCNKGRVYQGGEERNLRNTHEWHKKAEEIKEKSNYLCSLCKEQGIYTYDNLEVHHITKVTDNPKRLLDNYNLLCLCTKHHKEVEDNEEIKEHLFELAMLRENNY